MALLTIKQAAERSGIHERTLRRWCDTGHLKTTKLLDADAIRIWLIDSNDLDRIKRPPHISQIRKEEKRHKMTAKTSIS